MIFVKTQAGQQALKDRHGGLSSRQRSAFILFDGKRTLDEVLVATLNMGISMADVQMMVDQGLLEPLAGAKAHAGGAPAAPAAAAMAAAAHAPVSVPAPVAEAAPASAGEAARTPNERYQAAYPIAIELTAGLGLRGFRLNLAVEGAGGYDELAHLAPKIRDAVGEAGYGRLKQALFD
jgi:hypothetical protein